MFTLGSGRKDARISILGKVAIRVFLLAVLNLLSEEGGGVEVLDLLSEEGGGVEVGERELVPLKGLSLGRRGT